MTFHSVLLSGVRKLVLPGFFMAEASGVGSALASRGLLAPLAMAAGTQCLSALGFASGWGLLIDSASIEARLKYDAWYANKWQREYPQGVQGRPRGTKERGLCCKCWSWVHLPRRGRSPGQEHSA